MHDLISTTTSLGIFEFPNDNGGVFILGVFCGAIAAAMIFFRSYAFLRDYYHRKLAFQALSAVRARRDADNFQERIAQLERELAAVQFHNLPET